MFDAVYIPGGEQSFDTLLGDADALHFVNEAYKHCKTIAASGAGVDLLRASYVGALAIKGTDTEEGELVIEDGVITGPDNQVGKVAADFIAAMALHRHWSRESKDQIPA